MAYRRGPKVGDHYHVVGSTKITPELDDLSRRRTQAFLDTIGTQTRPLAHLLKEAWLQGMKDGAYACGKDIYE
jgi:hypothetical protein